MRPADGSSVRRQVVRIALGAALVACGSTEPKVPDGIAAFSALSVDGVVGATVTEVPMVKVTHSNGSPSSGVTVSFMASGGGSVGASTVTTDANGLASAGSWTLGTVAGSDTVTASASGPTGGPVIFTATAAPGPVSAVTVVAGADQSAVAGSAVPVAPAVKAADSFGNLVSGNTVTFTVVSGGGSVTGATATTDANGVATVGSWVLGKTAGQNSLKAAATSPSGAAATINATATPGQAAAVAVSAGDHQAGTAGNGIAVRPAVKVTDANGNGVPGTSVTFAVVTGGGSITGATATSDSTGAATVGSWTLGTVAGVNTLSATATGLTGSPLTFTDTGKAGPPAAVTTTDGDNQTAVVNTAVPISPSVQVTDANGNAVGGVAVTFAVASGGGSVTGGSATTGADGVAVVGSWKLGASTGKNTMTATVAGITAATITATATPVPGAAATIAISTGDGQSAFVGTATNVKPAVRVTDASGNPVNGTSVTFAVGTGGGSITGASQVTNTSGIATVGSWTMGPSSGANTLTATSTGLAGSPLTFTATAGPVVSAIAINAGSGQTAVAGAAVATAPSVKVTNSGGAGVPGVTVVFAVKSGGGSLTGASPVSDASGVATVGSWTLGKTAGANTITASVPALVGGAVTLSATGVAGPPAKYQVTAASTSPVAGGTDVITAQLEDVNGNHVATAGKVVTWSSSVSGTSFTSATSTTDATGQATATLTLGSTIGASYVVTATDDASLTGATAAFVSTAGTPTTIVATGARYTIIDSATTFTPVFTVANQFGVTIPNSSLTFVSRSVAATVSTAGVVTGAHRGQAFVLGRLSSNSAVADSVLVAVASVGGTAVTNDLARFDLRHDTTLTVAFTVDMRSSGEKLGAATVQITWDPAVLTYVSDADGSSGVGATVNSTGAATGSLSLDMASSAGFAGAVQIRTVTFKVATGTGLSGQLSTFVTELTGAGTFTNLLPKVVVVQHPFVTR